MSHLHLHPHLHLHLHLHLEKEKAWHVQVNQKHSVSQQRTRSAIIDARAGMKMTHLHHFLLKSVFSYVQSKSWIFTVNLDPIEGEPDQTLWTIKPITMLHFIYRCLTDNISISISIRSKQNVSCPLMTSPLTDAQWDVATPCDSFSLTYPNKKKKTGTEWIKPHIFISHCTFSEWRFQVGSFCLIRNEGLDGVPHEECTRDRYWKARITEIRRPQRKSNATNNPVSGENFRKVPPHPISFQEHYLLVQWFYSADDIRQVMPTDIEKLDR